MIAPNADLELTAAIDEADVGQVHEGQEAQFTVAAYGTRRFSGKVASVAHTPRPMMGTVAFEAVIQVPNPEHLFWPGMNANPTSSRPATPA